MSDLSQERLDQAVRAWAPAVRYYDEIDSTNRAAMEWAGEGAPEGCIVIADHQTAGRGRLDRTWFSAPGACLLFSLILRPGLEVERLGLVNLVASASLCSSVRDLELPATIKWPNDLMLRGRKAAGMLAETKVSQGKVEALVLGIGINVNLRARDFPKELRGSATSLAAAARRTFDRLEILTGFLRRFGPQYAGLSAARAQRVIEIYRPLCETLGRAVRVEMGDRTLEGVAVDVDDTGGLVLDSGEVVRIGDVVHLR